MKLLRDSSPSRPRGMVQIGTVFPLSVMGFLLSGMQG
jgi:hypothetical protein